jgi:hypothetical protein
VLICVFRAHLESWARCRWDFLSIPTIIARCEWVWWWNNSRLHGELNMRTLVEVEDPYYADQESGRHLPDKAPIGTKVRPAP